MEPPYFYVRDRPASAAHHWDYLGDRPDQALCGHGYKDPITLGEVDRPRAVCRACQALLPKYELAWWRAKAENKASALDELHTKFEALQEHADNQRNQLRQLQDARRAAKPRNAPRAGSAAKKSRRSNSNNSNAATEARLAKGRNDPTGLSAADVPTRGRPEKVKGGMTIFSGGLPGQGRRQR